MKLQEALRLLDIVTDVNGQYSKEERMHEIGGAVTLASSKRMIIFAVC